MDVPLLMKECNALLNDTDFRLSKVAERLALLKQKNNTSFTPARVRDGRHKSVKKSIYPSVTDSALSIDLSTTDSKKGPWLRRRASQHRRNLSINLSCKENLDTLDSRSYDPPALFMMRRIHPAFTRWNMSANIVVYGGQEKFAITSNRWP